MLKSLAVDGFTVSMKKRSNMFRSSLKRWSQFTVIVGCEEMKDESDVQWMDRVADMAPSAVIRKVSMRVDLRIFKAAPMLQSLVLVLPVDLVHLKYLKLENLQKLRLDVQTEDERNLCLFNQTIGMPNLRILDFIRPWRLKSAEDEFLRQVISMVSSLVSLRLNGYWLEMEPLEKILRATPLLQSLSLSGCVITPEMLAVLHGSQDVLYPGLRTLVLKNASGMDPDGPHGFCPEDLLHLVRSRAENAILGRCRKLQAVTIRKSLLRPVAVHGNAEPDCAQWPAPPLLDQGILEAMHDHDTNHRNINSATF
ncbi:hypothetical protein DACRYDRAFT_109908 [Dacryopinax primogenitus]|uniref:F-box domain-containing protein n=1 Tax=Dacryopinax primogenitus (strain DJM 731) TaxID=1858805 RepID=M5G607_DACPD|nr:uncharacterized protein DACRYDRAFT_109908 [Dacryopinax primogenitus]EJT99182.1 hypothetical protein DACRYDRAFT_109908 [Dacryopinax primogenitus]